VKGSALTNESGTFAAAGAAETPNPTATTLTAMPKTFQFRADDRMVER
jgi:hypothetical protein